MSRPIFSRKKDGKKVDPYPIGPKAKGKSSQTKKGKGRPRKAKDSWIEKFERFKTEKKLVLFFYEGAGTGLVGTINHVDPEEQEIEVLVKNDEVETEGGEWLGDGDVFYFHDYETDVEVIDVSPSTWKEAIDYDVRNLQVGDGENIRLYEDESEIKVRLDSYEEAGVSKADVQKIADSLWLLHDAGALSSGRQDEEEETVLGILKKYMSHKELNAKHDAVWHEAMFLAMDYEED